MGNPVVVLLLVSVAVNILLLGPWGRPSMGSVTTTSSTAPVRILEPKPPIETTSSTPQDLFGAEVADTTQEKESGPTTVDIQELLKKLETVTRKPPTVSRPTPLVAIQRLNGSAFLKPCPKSKLAEKERVHARGMQARRKYWSYLESKTSNAAVVPWSPNDPRMAAAYIHWSVEPTWTCNVMQRYGTLGDGGKVLCDVQRLMTSSGGNPPLVYSFGSRLQCDFEMDVKRFFPTSEVHVFDPTPGVVEQYQKSECGRQTAFHGIGLGGNIKSIYLDGINGYRGRTAPLDNLLSIQKSLGHESRIVDLLKIDIEGSEFDTFDYLAQNAAGWPRAKLIMLEVHLFDTLHGGTVSSHLAAFKKLFVDFADMGYRVYYKELNPYDARKCVEYALINEKYVA